MKKGEIKNTKKKDGSRKKMRFSDVRRKKAFTVRWHCKTKITKVIHKGVLFSSVFVKIMPATSYKSGICKLFIKSRKALSL